jgi:membrane-associated phospholipid phosphatase
MLIVVRHMATAALACLVATSSWCAPQDGQDRVSKNSTDSQNQTSAFFPTVEGNTLRCLCPLSFVKNLSSDQKTIWLSPLRLRERDTAWLLPFGIISAGLLASDHHFMQQVSHSPQRLRYSRDFGNAGTAALLGTAGGFYLWGGITENNHHRETGLLAGEALVNGTIVAETLKLVTQRPRPEYDNGRGRFGRGGSSFPSEHALAAWSIATVIAHEYPGTLTKLLAYGGASAVSVSRVTGRKHFVSDAVIGSAMGWAIGRQVYRAHHDPTLGGASRSAVEPEKPQLPRAAAEFASPYVPLDSWVYGVFDRLAALGYSPSAFASVRPWTRMECARLTGEVGELLAGGEKHPSDAVRLYAALQTEFAAEQERWGGSGTSGFRVESIYTRYVGITGVPLADGYHFGQTLVNDYGRPYGPGSNVLSGASGWASAGPVALYVRGEYQHAAVLPAYDTAVQQLIGAVDFTQPPSPTPARAIDQFRLLDAYVAWNFKSVQLSVGRQSLWWGPNRDGPLMYSDNAEPMDMVRLSKTSPWRLPGFFSWLGPMRWEFFFGLMAGHQHPAHPAVDGQKISFKPTPNLEFGFSRTIVFRPVTLNMLWRGFISVGDNVRTIPGSPLDVGDRRGGFDFSYRIPGLRKWLVVYNDALTDDNPSPLSAPHRSIMNPGIYLPQIPKIPKLDLRVETPFSDTPAVAKYNGHFFYWNSAFRDSYTNRGNLLGSWVGRQGRGTQLWSTYWLSPRNTLELGYREAGVDREFIPSGGHIRDFTVRATFLVGSAFDVSTFVQHERWTFPVLSPHSESDTTATVQLNYRPRRGKTLRVAQP